MAPHAVTILDSSDADQQERVGVLANLIGIDPSSYEIVLYN